MESLHDRYDMRSHTRADSTQAEGLPDSFVDAFAVVGPPAQCIEKLASLVALGLDKLVFVGATLGADRDAAAEADACVASEVLPALH